MRLEAAQKLRILRAATAGDVPVYAHFGITHRCGLTCKMCGIWRYGNKAEELSLDQIDTMARRMRRIGVAHVAIGGGEPFEREDLEEVARIFVKHGLNLRILTNGVTTDPAQLDRVIDAGCKHFSVSLDSLHPARYDYICEQDGTWDRGVRTLVHIAERVLPQGGLPTINCVVSNLNLEELDEMVRFAGFLGFHISFLPIELLPEATAGGRDWEARFIRYRPEMGLHQDQPMDVVRKRINATYDNLIRLKRRGAPILNSTPYLEASRNYLLTGRFPPEGCHAGRLYFSVAPNGEFTICHRKAQDHISFLDDGFEAYFASDAYEKARHHEATTCEGCMRACWIDTSYMMTTMQGFLETAFLTVKPRKRKAPRVEDALAWAHRDGGPVVPVAAAK